MSSEQNHPFNALPDPPFCLKADLVYRLTTEENLHETHSINILDQPWHAYFLGKCPTVWRHSRTSPTPQPGSLFLIKEEQATSLCVLPAGKAMPPSQHSQGTGERLGSTPTMLCLEAVVRWGGSHEGTSESDGISPTTQPG